MKKRLYFFVTCILLISCSQETTNETDNEIEINNEITTTKNLIVKAPCTIDSPECGSKNSLVVFTYKSQVHNQNINWSVSNGNMTLISGQRTTNAIFKLANNFNGGTVNVTAGACNLSKRITPCSSPPPCGLSISRIYELNGNQEDEVAFGTAPTLSPGWTITSSWFSVTYQSNNVSNHVGSLNPIGYPQILIPVYCSDKVKKVTVWVTASSGTMSCVKTVSTNFLVCGTGGGIGDL